MPPDLAQDDHIEGLPLGTRGGILIRHNFPLDAEYQFSVKLLRNIVGYMTGLEWPHQLEITRRRRARVHLRRWAAPDDNKMSDANMAAAADTIDERLQTRIPVKAGPRVIGVAFIRKNSAESDEPLQPHTRDHDLQNMNGIPLVDHVRHRGPVRGHRSRRHAEPPPHLRLPPCAAPRRGRRDACATKILSTLARRAYRRPGHRRGARDADQLLRGRPQERRRFEAGIQNAPPLDPGEPEVPVPRRTGSADGRAPARSIRLGDLELASRLSFFLWSSIPDDRTADASRRRESSRTLPCSSTGAAHAGRPARRRRSSRNFAGQWLFLRNLQSHLPDNKTFPNFDDNLRQAFRQRDRNVLRSIMREDRSVLDLLTADYTFVNERLARHYGIPNVYGSHFRRVTLTDENRRGLLGQGSVLTVTSYPNRTSPVLRGKWILENILGTPPPPPPADVPALPRERRGRQGAARCGNGSRQHRKNPACASCHRVMDPLGFSLENFDAIGRVADEGSGRGRSMPPASWPMDARSTARSALRQALLKHPEQFVGTMTEKLLTYALGRGLEHYDMPVVRSIAQRCRAAELPVLVADRRHRQEHAVSDEESDETPSCRARQPAMSRLAASS